MSARLPVLLALALLALLLVPSVGHADRRFSGKSSQNRSVHVTVGDDGAPKRVTLAWRGRCAKGRFQTATVFRPGRVCRLAPLRRP